MLFRRLAVTFAAWSLVGCGASASDGLPSARIVSDASVGLDAAGVPDGGTALDAQPALDAGEVPDAGPGAADSGPAPDAGEPAALRPGDPGFIRAWFADYNAGQRLDYLEAPFTDAPSGDPRYATAPAHRHIAEVAYGPFPRNQLDAWLLRGANPAPVAVFIHGGGFVSGTRESISTNPNNIPRLLQAGLSVVTISYRWAYRDPEAALRAPIPNDEGTVHDENGTRLDYILRDCARAIQFVRYHASDWGIDASRIAVYGGSAGAGCSTWIGAVEDLAVPDHVDPVLRESTRVHAVGHQTGQPTYAWTRWPELLSMDPGFVFSNVEGEAVRLTQMPLQALSNTEEGRRLDYVLDYYEHLGPGDAPLFSINLNPDLDETMITEASEVIHHPRGHVALYERCAAAGLDCGLRTRDRSEGPDRDLLTFLRRVLVP